MEKHELQALLTRINVFVKGQKINHPNADKVLEVVERIQNDIAFTAPELCGHKIPKMLSLLCANFSTPDFEWFMDVWNQEVTTANTKLHADKATETNPVESDAEPALTKRRESKPRKNSYVLAEREAKRFLGKSFDGDKARKVKVDSYKQYFTSPVDKKKKKEKKSAKIKRASKKKTSSNDNATSVSNSAPNSTTQQPQKVVWLYEEDNQWKPYDTDASDSVEKDYQLYLTDTSQWDVRSIKSGLFSYQVDFTNMQQKNIVHENHKIRNIRRSVVSV